MQFTSPFDELFEEVIRPVCAEIGIDAYPIFTGLALSCRILFKVWPNPNVVIAEITPANANVFYELGYAHALRKPVIALAEHDTALPFERLPRHIL